MVLQLKRLNQIAKIQARMDYLGIHPLDVLLVGATGVGKSSTLNALFGQQIATVGIGVAPETMHLKAYQYDDCLRFWDSAGLGDGVQADWHHRRQLINILQKAYEHQNKRWGYIDLVLVILDGSSRDLGTAYRLLEQVILRCISPDRVMVVVNQADMAQKSRYWDSIQNRPKPVLQDFLDKQMVNIQKRLLEATGLKIAEPIYYSATKAYNLEVLMDSLIIHLPKQKRRL